jgi:fatty-acid desaturase
MRAKKTNKRQLWVLPILPTFLGIFASMIIVNLIELFKNQAIVIVSEIAVIIIMLIGIRMLFGRTFFSKAFSLIQILKFAVDGVYAIIISCYVSALFLVSAGFMPDFSKAVAFVVQMVVITAVASVVEGLAHGLGSKNKD